MLWDVYGGLSNYAILKGHKNAILETFWGQDSKYVTLVLRNLIV